MKPYPAYKPSGVPWLGVMPAHWKKLRVANAFNSGSGTTPPTDEPDWYEGTVPWVQTSELRESVVLETEKNLTEAAIAKFSALRVHKKGSVVVAMYGATIGRVGVLGVDAAVNQACCVLSPVSNVTSKFMFWWLQSMRTVLALMGTGGGQPNISQEKIAQLRFFSPEPDEQQAIATYLDRETVRIDTLLAEKVRLTETLREYRQATISEVVTQGLNPAAPKKPSGVPWLGEVPAHWSVQRLRFRCKLNPSVKDRLSDDDVASFLPMEAIGDDGSLNLEATRSVGDVASGYTYFEDGDVTIAKITPCFENGKGAVMRGLLGGIGFGTTELIVIRPNDTVHPDWLYCLTQSDAFRKRGEAMMYGAGGQKRVPDLYVRDLPIAWPPIEEQQAIADYLASETARIDKLVDHVQDEIKLLQEFRAATITDAVTGKIQVAQSSEC